MLKGFFNHTKSVLLYFLFVGFCQSAAAQFKFSQSVNINKGFDLSGLSVAYLDNGDYILAGNVIDTVYLDANTKIEPGTLSTFFIARLNKNDSLVWVKKVSHSNQSNYIKINTPVKIVNNNHILVAGTFTGYHNFPNGTNKNAGSLADVFWLRYNAGGDCKAMGTYADAVCGTAEMNTKLQVFLAGRTTVGGNNAFIAGFDSTGAQDSKMNYVFTGTKNNRDFINSLVQDDEGNIYFSGKACSDSIGFYGFNEFIDASNDLNRYTLILGKIGSDRKMKWMKGAEVMAGSRPYDFNIRQAILQKSLNRIVFAGVLEGANFILGKDTFAQTSTVNTDARKPIMICVDTSGNVQWHSSLELKSENQRGEIFTLNSMGEDLVVSADIEHYLSKSLDLGGVKFDFAGKAFLILTLDSIGKIKSAFGSEPKLKQNVVTVNSCSIHPKYGIAITQAQHIADSISIQNIHALKGSNLLFARNCNLKAELKSFNREICENSPKFTIEATPSSGKFFGDIISPSGEVNPSNMQSGTYYFKYQISDELKCQITINDSIIINRYTAISFLKNDSVFCPKDTLIKFNVNPTGGEFIGNGITSGNFNPMKAGTGTHFVVYQFTNARKCTSKDSIKIRVRGQNECIQSGTIGHQLTHVQYYPNPFDNKISIHSASMENFNVEFYTSTGTLLEKYFSVSNGAELNVSTLPKGLILIRINFGNSTQNSWVIHQ